jgi:hypothetical protein
MHGKVVDLFEGNLGNAEFEELPRPFPDIDGVDDDDLLRPFLAENDVEQYVADARSRLDDVDIVRKRIILIQVVYGDRTETVVPEKPVSAP